MTMKVVSAWEGGVSMTMKVTRSVTERSLLYEWRQEVLIQ